LSVLGDGLIAVDGAGRIASANAAARLWLVRGGRMAQGRLFSDVFDMRFDLFIDAVRREPEVGVDLRLHDGRSVFARVFASSTRISRSLPETHRTRALETPRAPTAELDRFDTGDGRIAIIVRTARRAADRGANIQIRGETGTGKLALARAIHAEGPRRDGPFVALSCAISPAEKLEVDLFGAGDTEGGKYAQAAGGTLCLDEIDALPASAQTRLLGLIEQRDGAAAPGCTIIVIARGDLRQDVACGRFRDDLFFRLTGLTLTIPPLRERNDVPQLAVRLLEETQPERAVEIAPEVIAMFLHYEWPGNVREMQNVVRIAVAMMEPSDRTLRLDHLPLDFVEQATRAPSGRHLPEPTEWQVKNLASIEVTAIRRAVDAHGGNIAAAARELGISRNTIYRKLSPVP
jgi:transcriptional regulator of acetoin/glycerol metabolism